MSFRFSYNDNYHAKSALQKHRPKLLNVAPKLKMSKGESLETISNKKLFSNIKFSSSSRNLIQITNKNHTSHPTFWQERKYCEVNHSDSISKVLPKTITARLGSNNQFLRKTTNEPKRIQKKQVNFVLCDKTSSSSLDDIY